MLTGKFPHLAGEDVSRSEKGFLPFFIATVCFAERKGFFAVFHGNSKSTVHECILRPLCFDLI